MATKLEKVLHILSDHIGECVSIDTILPKIWKRGEHPQDPKRSLNYIVVALRKQGHVIDFKRKTGYTYQGRQTQPQPPSPYSHPGIILKLLQENSDGVVSHDQILDALWPNIEREPDSSLIAVKVYVTDLRRRGYPVFSVYSQGYTLKQQKEANPPQLREMIALFYKNEGKVVQLERLRHTVGVHGPIHASTLRTLIYRFRKQLPENYILISVHMQGYKLIKWEQTNEQS